VGEVVFGKSVIWGFGRKYRAVGKNYGMSERYIWGSEGRHWSLDLVLWVWIEVGDNCHHDSQAGDRIG